jgi:hypothetical protein
VADVVTPPSKCAISASFEEDVEEEEEGAAAERPDWLRRRDDEGAPFEPAATPEDEEAD